MRVLATSRELLGVAGERVVGVRSLRVASVPDVEAIAACEAVRLFVERAGATRSEFRLDADNADSIVEICRRLDGIPLAVELAAARVTSMGPGEIADLLDERFQLLTGGRRRGVERHQTLRATVDWSYSLLDARDRVVFDRLGVFAGSFDADAATVVAGDDELSAWDIRDALDDLAAKSMVDLDAGPGGGTRYRLLETLRQFALERLGDTGRAEEYRRRHAAYYVSVRGDRGSGHGGPRRGLVGREVRGRTRQPPRRGRLGARRRGAGRRGPGSADHRLARQPMVLSPVDRSRRVGRGRSCPGGDLDTGTADLGARHCGL